MDMPLMPKATAVWLIDNTRLTFEQIGAFCGLHTLEVQALADGDIGAGINGRDPIAHDELTREEIARCEALPDERLVMAKRDSPRATARSGGPRYTPVSKRQDKPDGIAWLLRNRAELSDAQIGKLIGTTKNTITAVRERTHWNTSNIRPQHPVDLGLCTYIDLAEETAKARAKLPPEEREALEAAERPQLDPEPVEDESPLFG
ncbi:MAG: DUF1013 domain-containing protein [Alphaproteobacteria bacterium]|nr:DUF1013 domain-containing protein [Alphaproteobacteria bacterium]MDE0409515.1 DUF1013 domain-containing protein [Alphaproteobacteria bacterium]